MDVDAGSSETPVDQDHCAYDAALAVEAEVFEQTRSSADVCTTRQSRKRSSAGQQSVPSKLEVEVDNEQDHQSEREGDSSPPRSASQKSPRRKSRRVTRQKKNAVEPEEEDTKVKTPSKRHSSRRSTIATSECVAQPEPGAAATEAVTEEVSSQPSQPQSEKVEHKTPRRSRRSRRSLVAKAEGEVQEHAAPMEVVPEIQEGVENQSEKKSRPNRKERRSRRSQLPNTNNTEEAVAMETEDMETANEAAVESTEEAGAQNAKKRRQSRRSVAKQQGETARNNEDTSDAVPSVEKPAALAKNVSIAEVVQSKVVSPEATTPKRSKRQLYSMQAKDDLFLTPGPPVPSQKRSAAKRRRRTATMVALSTAKSPEEA